MCACRRYLLRIRAPCTLRDVKLSGGGATTRNRWGYKQFGLVVVAGPEDTRARFSVSMTRVRVTKTEEGNGVRVCGAAALRMQDCTVSNCRHNGVIVLVRFHHDAGPHIAPTLIIACACAAADFSVRASEHLSHCGIPHQKRAARWWHQPPCPALLRDTLQHSHSASHS